MTTNVRKMPLFTISCVTALLVLNMSSCRGRNELTEREWYEKAAEKSLTFLSEIDPNLRVSVREVTILPVEGVQSREIALLFTHTVWPELTWTMSIQQNDVYLETQLEEAVRKVYQDVYSKVRQPANVATSPSCLIPFSQLFARQQYHRCRASFLF